MKTLQSYLVCALGSLEIFGLQTPKVWFVQDSSSQLVLEWTGGLKLFVQLVPWWDSFSNGPSEGLNDLEKIKPNPTGLFLIYKGELLELLVSIHLH